VGRTEPTFRRLKDRQYDEWRPYRDQLTRQDAAHFDALWRRARAHASACTNAGREAPMQPILLSVLLEHEMAVRGLRAAARAEAEAPLGPPEPRFDI
jgi:hypothetical protein